MAESKKSLRVKLVKSPIGREGSQRATLKALGLGKLGSTSEIVDNDCTRGMIFKVKHMVEVEEI